VKEWHRSIFGTGDKLKATTMTSNHSFVRAAIHQGIEFDVYLHSSRALSERKADFIRKGLTDNLSIENNNNQ